MDKIKLKNYIENFWDESIIPTLIYSTSIYFLGEEIGNLDLGSIIGSYIGLLLLCSIFSSISIFASSINVS